MGGVVMLNLDRKPSTQNVIRRAT